MTLTHTDSASAGSATMERVAVDDLARRIIGGSRPVRVGIVGAGGTGKTVLLGELSQALRAHGLRVVEGGRVSAREAPERIAVLVDDAHALTDDETDRLRELLGDDGPHVVVAFRPWPRSGATAALVDRLERIGDVRSLHPMTSAEIRERGARVNGTRPSAERAARILEATRGNPRLVDVMLGAGLDEEWDDDGAGPLPDDVLDRLRVELDRLDPDLQEFLCALAVGFSLAGPAFATAPRFAGADLRSLAAAARASGLVAADATLAPLVRSALLQSTLPHDLWMLRRELLDAMEVAHAPLGDTALVLARQGFRDARVESALRSRADELLGSEPAEARKLYEALLETGADEAAIAGRLAVAAWGAGDPRSAGRIADRALSRGSTDDLALTVGVASASWARKGMLRRSAEAARTLARSDPSSGPLAAVCLAGVGEVGEARELLAAATSVDYPRSSQVALSLMAEGVLDALEGSAERALSALLQASSIMNDAGESVPLPEAPAVLAAQVALESGALGVAQDVLGSAIEARQGGPAMAARLRLTRALVALRADRPARARDDLEAATDGSSLGLRDELLAHAVRVGLARHTDDLAALLKAWSGAREAIAGMAVDLYAVLAIAELQVAAARLRESHVLDSAVATTWDLLERAGHPSCWSAVLHWAAIEAGILRNDRELVEEHAAALSRLACGDRTAARLARAGRTWAAAIGGRVVPAEVEDAVRDLVAAGYPWDASRLAGHAAARAPEHRDTLQLLALARSLHADDEDGGTGEAPVPTRGSVREEGVLSAREREVARLVLEGKTYAEIGNAIFISPRTAEHHIARIRRRLGVTSRSELLARLRLELEGDPE